MTLDRVGIVASRQCVIDTFKGLRDDLLKVFGTLEPEFKEDRSVVTEWDVKVEDALRSALKKEFPDIGFVGEETGKHGNEKTYWLVDPIDGTNSFVRGIPTCTNMAALIDDGQVIASVIYDFIQDKLYTAIKGEGAFCNDEKISVNKTRELGSFIAYALSSITKFGLLQEAGREMGVRVLLPIGSAGHAYIMLAEGKIDGVISFGSRDGLHDNAPGVLLAEEAGATMLQYDNGVGVYRREFIIGSPKMIEVVERSGLL